MISSSDFRERETDMTNFHHIIQDVYRLKDFLESPEIRSNVKTARSVLVQVFSAQTDQIWIESIVGVIEEALPTAVLIGSTTAGEIADGHLLTEQTVLSVTFFEMSVIKPIAFSCLPGDEYNCAQYLSQAIDLTGLDIAGILLLATPLSIDVANLFNGMHKKSRNYPIFGGGAGVYTLMSNSILNNSMIFCGNKYYRHGLIAVVFAGENLHISSHTYLGWQPLSKEMTITEADGMVVRKIDDIRAFEIYQRYLEINNDTNFFFNVQAFPFLLERNGQLIARVPFFVDQDGNIEFVADLKAGEKFRIGYGNPETIVQNAKGMAAVMSDFEPDAIFLFSCICHRFLMQNEADLEIQPISEIAPTTGFYTYGEFYSDNGKIEVLNSTTIVVGMREGEKRKATERPDNPKMDYKNDSQYIDPYANIQNGIISRLVHFIGVVNAELEQANKELTRTSEIDKLTQIYNRFKIDSILEQELHKTEQNHARFSVIMVDIDHFKQVNDCYGHDVGDDVLVQMVEIIRGNIRKTDSAGRWGGEEFLLILPDANLEAANKIAEKIRTAMSSYEFPIAGHQTSSFGVACFLVGDNQHELLVRADKALYEAKNSGRNKVVSS